MCLSFDTAPSQMVKTFFQTLMKRQKKAKFLKLSTKTHFHQVFCYRDSKQYAEITYFLTNY